MIECDKFIVTEGSEGCSTYEKGGRVLKAPAVTNSVIDTVGAGDAFFAITAPLVASGAQLADAGFIGNAIGAMKVGIVGHRKTVDKPSLVKFLTAMLK